MRQIIETRWGRARSTRSTRSTGRRRRDRGAALAVAVAMFLGSGCAPSGDRAEGSTGEVAEASTAPIEETSTAPGGTEQTEAGGGSSVDPGLGWPVGEPQDHGLDPAQLDDLGDYFAGIGSDCMVVIKDGHLVASRHWNGTTHETDQEVWSISKSVTSTLVGIAQDQGLLDIDDPASMYIEEWQGTPSEDVTIRNLLSNDSGRYYSFESSFVELVGTAEDKTAYSIGLDQQHPPGTRWEYNSAAIQTLEAVLEQATGGSVESFAQEHLFTPTGMTASILDDAVGNDLMFMGTQAGCEDIARLGDLVLHDGAANGHQVVSEDWMTEATAASQDLMTGYGFLWWRNSDGRRVERSGAITDDGSFLFPTAPSDLVVAAGVQDQILLVSPSEDLIVVRLGRHSGPDDIVILLDEIFGRLTLSGSVEAPMLASAPCHTRGVDVPEVRYADTDGLKIAWHEYGVGPDVLAIPPLVSNIELVWEHKYYRRFLEYFARHVHMVAFDKRGIGLSDRFDQVPTLEERIGDIVAVMDAAGLDSATVLGTSEGGLMAQLFTVLHPERVERLILMNSSPGAGHLIELATDPDGSMPRLVEKLERFERLGETWGQDPQFMVDWFSPTRSDDPTFVRWVGRLQRQSATAKELALQVESIAFLDAADRLGEIAVPTLVAHAIDDPVVPFASAEFLASRIPGAKLAALPGDDHFLFTHPEWQTALDTCIEFVTGTAPRGDAARSERGRRTFGWESLTASEARVVDLAAEGLSNKQIAEKLFVSVATVKSHLVHIYQKLEIDRRAELVAAVAARRR